MPPFLPELAQWEQTGLQVWIVPLVFRVVPELPGLVGPELRSGQRGFGIELEQRGLRSPVLGFELEQVVELRSPVLGVAPELEVKWWLLVFAVVLELEELQSVPEELVLPLVVGLSVPEPGGAPGFVPELPVVRLPLPGALEVRGRQEQVQREKVDFDRALGLQVPEMVPVRSWEVGRPVVVIQPPGLVVG